MSDDITAEDIRGVRVLTLNRPSKRNALTESMYAFLADQFDEAQQSPGVGVVLLLAEGGSFTAGNDLSTFAGIAAAPASTSTPPRGVLRFLDCLAMAGKPLVAGVQGNAVGIGLTLLLHCDVVVIARDAKLAAPFVGLGLVPEGASSLLMVERIGYARAFALFATGQSLSGEQAVAYGIASLAVEAADVKGEAMATALRLTQLPQGALLATKALLRRQDAMLAQIRAENAVFFERLASAEAREVFKAMAEKRPPDLASIPPNFPPDA